MSFLRRHSRIAVVALICLALGAGASAIASAGAATGTTAKSTHAHAHARHRGLRAREMRWVRRAVHAELVVPTKHGFVNVTVDRGAVGSVTGDQLTIIEGTRTQTYRTVTLTIPPTAKVRDNRQTASLSSLSEGQRVIVVQAPQRTLVVARPPRRG